jgi:hypothetical protein
MSSTSHVPQLSEILTEHQPQQMLDEYTIPSARTFAVESIRTINRKRTRPGILTFDTFHSDQSVLSGICSSRTYIIRATELGKICASRWMTWFNIHKSRLMQLDAGKGFDKHHSRINTEGCLAWMRLIWPRVEFRMESDTRETTANTKARARCLFCF